MRGIAIGGTGAGGVGKPCILWLFEGIWVRFVIGAGGLGLFGLGLGFGFVWRFLPQGLQPALSRSIAAFLWSSVGWI